MIYPKDYGILGTTIIVLGFLFWVFSPYLQAEILTNFYQTTFDTKEICNIKTNQDFRESKIISYEKYRKTAKIYCLYGDSRKNTSITLYFSENKWIVEYIRNFQKDGAYYWPIYY